MPTKDTLCQRQALPLDAKVAMTRNRVRDFYDHFLGDVYISFSGGKDSTVLLDIVKDMYPEVPAVFCDTGLEYPEVREFALSKADVVIKPRKTFKQVIEDYGYPVISKEQAMYIRQYRHTNSEKLRDIRWNGSESGGFKIKEKHKYLVDAPFEVSEWCCEVMKKSPFKRYEKETGRHPYIGSMAEESKLRLQEYLQHGCNAFENTRPKSTPLGFWTEQDILRYIKVNGLEYACVYGDIVQTDLFGDDLRTTGLSRTGCMFCMFGVHLEKQPNRFQMMKETHPKQWKYCLDKLGERQVLEYIGVPYE